VVKIRIDAASYADLMRGGRPPFRPGMSASVYIHTNTVNDAISVPIQCVTTRELDADIKKAKAEENKGLAENTKKTSIEPIKELVFIVSGDTIKQIEVKTGIQNTQYIQIVSGLKGDEEVVSAPYKSISKTLKSGMKIQKVSEKELYGSKDKKGKED
jgi:HlyD family secretion protein